MTITELLTLIASLLTLVTVVILVWQTNLTRKNTHADFTLRLHDMFFINKNNAKIIQCLETHKHILNWNKGEFSKSDLDDYLGTIELISLYRSQGVLNKRIISEMFGYYIILSWKDSEIQDYINEIREVAKSDNYYKPFEKLAKELISMEKI